MRRAWVQGAKAGERDAGDFRTALNGQAVAVGVVHISRTASSCILSSSFVITNTLNQRLWAP